MANPLDRTWYNSLIDDDGTGTTGTVWNKSQVDNLMDVVDASLAPIVTDAGFKLTTDQPGISRNTADGADTGTLLLSGGGAVNTNRGAYLQLSGNEAAAGAGGNASIILGNVGTAGFRVYRGSDFAVVFAAQTSGVVQFPFGQLEFPVAQNPSAAANILDDYREGSWLPTVQGGGGASGVTYAARDGRYVKVGTLVIVEGWLQLSNKGTLTGAIGIGGLPFAGYPVSLYGAIGVNFQGLATNWSVLWGILGGNATAMELRGCPGGGGTSSNTALSTTDITNATVFTLTGMYIAAN